MLFFVDSRFLYSCFTLFLIFNFSSAVQNPIILSCRPNPCRNSGKCITQRGVNFCQCPSGYVGSLCQFVDPCTPSQCQNGGSCTPVVSSNDNEAPLFNCSCPIGYSASLCEISIKNACDNDPCKNHGTCHLITLDHFDCICPSGYKGETCEIVDFCAPQPCKNGASCTSKSDGFQCRCALGFTGPTCTDDVDECTTNKPCVNGNCVNVHGSYRCECNKGFSGKNCDEVYEPCNPNPCQNNGQCVLLGSYKYRCQCLLGFSGQNCEVNVDDCANSLCKNGGRCVDGIGNYTCDCPKNWKGQFCNVDVDECAEQSNVCQNGGTCSNYVGGFLCVCVNGWEGQFCQLNHDDCVGTKCYNGGTCHDRVASFFCECPIGYTGLLCHLRDACMSSPCQSPAICDTSPVDGSYVCSCPQGFKGVDCSEDIDECALGNPCEHGGTCVNTPGSYICKCAVGWTGVFCDQNVNECASNPCLNDATCLDDIGKFRCVCMPGFAGIFCETNIDDCANKPCKNNGVCRDLVNNFTCACQRGFSGRYCEQDLDDCATNPCLNNGICHDLANGYKCNCPKGFSGSKCEKNVDECTNKPCANNGICKDLVDGYTCSCSNGYSGRNCEILTDACVQNPCSNRGTCIDLGGHYVCKCPDTFTGVHCERLILLGTTKTALNSATTSVDIHAYDIIDEDDRKNCSIQKCSSKSNNGVCNAECNYPACGYDGTDCSAGLNPFAACKTKEYCVHVFKDGKCDSVCNVETCLFDGFDCLDKTDLKCNPLYETYCIRHLGDGNCDSGCNTRGCNYDGGDCAGTKDKRDVLVGAVALVLTVAPEVFVNRSNEFLMSLGKILDVNLHIKQDDKGRPMVYRWNSRDGVEGNEPIPMQMTTMRVKRQSPAVVFAGVFVVLVVDITKCTLDGRTDCFSKVENVASFLAAPQAKEQLKEQMGLNWDIYSATPEVPQEASWSKTVWIASVAVGLVMIFFVLFVLERKRKIITKLWHIPGGSSSNNSDAFRRASVCRSSLDKSSVFAVPNLYESDVKKAKLSHRSPGGNETPDPGRYCSGEYSQFDNYITCRKDVDQCSESETYSTYTGDSESTAIPMTQEESALHIGITCCRVEAVKAMLKRCADPNKTDNKGNAALHKAVNINHPDIVKLILTESVTLVDIEAKNDDGCTPLILAAKNATGSCCIMKMLIEFKASTAAQDNEGRTALHWVAVQNDVEGISFLLSKGANKDATNFHDQTPLFYAVKEGHAEATRFLLDNGASKDMADDMDRTPLQIAEDRGYKDIVSMLLDSRINSLNIIGLDASTIGGTLPHGVGRKKPTPPKRTKSLKEAKCDNNGNVLRSKISPVNHKKKRLSSDASPQSAFSSSSSSGVPSVGLSSVGGSPAFSVESPPIFGTPSPASTMCHQSMTFCQPQQFQQQPVQFSQHQTASPPYVDYQHQMLGPQTVQFSSHYPIQVPNFDQQQMHPEMSAQFTQYHNQLTKNNRLTSMCDVVNEQFPSNASNSSKAVRQCQFGGGGYTHYTTPNNVGFYDYADYYSVDAPQFVNEHDSVQI